MKLLIEGTHTIHVDVSWRMDEEGCLIQTIPSNVEEAYEPPKKRVLRGSFLFFPITLEEEVERKRIPGTRVDKLQLLVGENIKLDGRQVHIVAKEIGRIPRGGDIDGPPRGYYIIRYKLADGRYKPSRPHWFELADVSEVR